MPIRDLPPQLTGELRFDEDIRAAAADDFGHLLHRIPAGVLRPASAADVAATIRWAAECGRTFAAQGRRHSVYGRGQAPGGVVADMTTLGAIHDVRPDRIVVDAGASWRQVLDATLPLGRTPPVLVDYLDLSVGGTLSVGGIGARTPARGVQTDHIAELDVVTGTGEQITCSPARDAGLFDAVRAGLGQVAVLIRATIPLVPAPQQVRRLLLSYPDLATMLRDQRLLAADGRFDAVQGAALATPDGGWTFRLDAAVEFSGPPPEDAVLLAGLSDDRAAAQPSTVSYLDYLDRLAALEEALRANGQWAFPHPWLMTFVGDAAVESVVGGELARLASADLGAFGQVAITAYPRRSTSTPLLRLPADELCYAVNLVRFPTTDRAAGAARQVDANRAVYQRVRAAGGVLYPVSAVPMSAEDWRQHFGPVFDQLATAKQKFDPEHVLTPGYEVFPRAR